MNHHRGANQGQPHRTPYERLSQRIEEAAEREGRYSNAERIRQMREAFFADVEGLKKSGTVIIPKWNG